MFFLNPMSTQLQRPHPGSMRTLIWNNSCNSPKVSQRDTREVPRANVLIVLSLFLQQLVQTKHYLLRRGPATGGVFYRYQTRTTLIQFMLYYKTPEETPVITPILSCQCPFGHCKDRLGHENVCRKLNCFFEPCSVYTK